MMTLMAEQSVIQQAGRDHFRIILRKEQTVKKKQQTTYEAEKNNSVGDRKNNRQKVKN